MNPATPPNPPSPPAPSPAEQMLDFLRRQVIVDPGLEIDSRTPLVTSGLIDSFALIEVLSQLERITRTRIPAGRLSPEHLDTVEMMLEVAQRLGQPQP